MLHYVLQVFLIAITLVPFVHQARILERKGVCAMWKIQSGYSSVNKTFRLPEDLTAELETLAGQNNISLNQLVIQCLRYAVENLDKDDEH